MPLRDLGQLLVLSVLFGSAFLFMRLLVPVFGPLWLIDARVLLAAGVLIIWAVLTGQPLRFGHRLRDWLVMGALNAAIPYTLIAFAELHVNSSLAAIFMATIPLFTAVISALWLEERFTPKLAIGLALGSVGVVALSGWNTVVLSPVTLLAVAALLVSALSYALGIVFVGLRFGDTSPLTLSIGNFLAAGVLLLPLAVFAPPPQPPPPPAVLVLLAFVLLPTALALVFDLHLLKKLGPTRLSTVAYLIPVSGALLGFIFLSEPLHPTMLAGFVIILLSVALVTDVKIALPRKLTEERSLP